jgi:hypothetical protein
MEELVDFDMDEMDTVPGITKSDSSIMEEDEEV